MGDSHSVPLTGGRGLHDASRGFATRVGGGSVICHHDPGPNNTVFRGGRPVALIDFDFAAPGDPLEDVAYMAWSWCISSKPTRGDPEDQAQQVRALADAYGLSAAQRRQLPHAILKRLARNEYFWTERIHQVPSVVHGPTPVELVTWTRQESDYVASNREVFVNVLS